MSEWSHLPNAAHIDRILAHLEAHPEKWTLTRVVARSAARGAAWTAAWNAQRNAVLGAAWDAALTATVTAQRNAALTVTSVRAAAVGAIIALVSNDTCAYLLKEKPEHVELLASLGIDEAILLLPAVRAMSHE
jgi:hypothetical protein